MQSDLITRVLLGTIVVCLLLLVAQGMGVTGAASEPRYEVVLQNMRKSVMMLRVDTHTGVVWRRPLTTEGPWVIVDKETRDAMGQSATEPDPPSAVGQ